MANAKFDDNRIAMATGISSTDPSVVLPFLVDPATGRLEILVVPATDSTPVLPSGVSKRDDNRETVSSGLAETVPQDLLLDSRTGDLWVDIEIET